jgi:O-antigen/teichoic acid export membrane protein
LRRLFLAFFLFLGFVNLIFVFIGRSLMIMLYGADFAPSYGAYLFLIPASFGLTFGSLFNTYIWSKGFPVMCIVMPFIALLINIGLNIWWIPLFGIRGASMATSVAYLAWLFLLMGYENYRTSGKMLPYFIPRFADFTLILQEVGNLRKRRR